MKITVFTSNQPRHVALIERLAKVADHVWAVQECNTVFPGRVADFFAKSAVMQEYFSHVLAAERAVFGTPRFPRSDRGNITQMPIKMGDLGFFAPGDLGTAMQADVFVVFGSSYIKGELCRQLAERRAINIHMGISPQYRGSSCNFWALYDNNPHLVGATLHLLTAGLDSGPMICHALPPRNITDGFALGMSAVAAGHGALLEVLGKGNVDAADAVPQDRRRQIRYTRNADFTDAIAAEYLARPARAGIRECESQEYLRPYVLSAA